jgi:peptidoglycan hydrolase-like protein with peptidoglycan-binding domain
MTDLAAAGDPQSAPATVLPELPGRPERPGRPGRPGRRALITSGLAAAAVAGGLAAAAAAGTFARSAGPAALGSDLYHTTTAPVLRQSLVSQTQLQASLGETGAYSVVNQAQGTITSLPAAGRVVRQGEPLYAVNGSPVLLLYGSVPAWRDLAEGMTGPDVAELNADLAALGYASAAALSPLDYFGPLTVTALESLQARAGITVTGTLPLGQAVFLPTAALVTSLGQGTVLGGQAMPGSVLLSASSTARLVSVALDPSMQGEVHRGQQVSITLPSGQVTPGVVTSVAALASASGDITAAITPTRPAALGGLEQAPVQVTITTGSVTNALVVPVDALLAQASGGYAVEVTGPRGPRLVPVSTGLFDDASGEVQVTGRGLAQGQRVVVPST